MTINPKNKPIVNHKGWAIVWRIDFPNWNIKAGDVVSIHKEQPVSSQEFLWEVKPITFIIND